MNVVLKMEDQFCFLLSLAAGVSVCFSVGTPDGCWLSHEGQRDGNYISHKEEVWEFVIFHADSPENFVLTPEYFISHFTIGCFIFFLGLMLFCFL